MRESGRSTLLMQRMTGILGERLAQDEAGLRQRALGRVDEQDDTVDHREAALDLATEVGVAGVSMMLIVMPSASPASRAALPA